MAFIKKFASTLKTTAKILDSSSEAIAKSSENLNHFMDEVKAMQEIMCDSKLASNLLTFNLKHLIERVERNKVNAKLAAEAIESIKQMPEGLDELFSIKNTELLKMLEQNKNSASYTTMTWPSLERPIVDTPLLQTKADVIFKELLIDLEDLCEEINKKCRNDEEFCKDYSLALSKANCPLWIRLKIPACQTP